MRRPLCLIGMVYVVAIIIGITVTVPEAPVYEYLDRQQVTVAGYVDWKEYRISGAKEVPVITLQDAVILKEDQIANLEQILLGSDKVSCSDTAFSFLCYLNQNEMPPMGSYVIVQGKFYSFTHATNPGEFDSAEYYRILKQQGKLMQVECVAVSSEYDGFREGLYQIRDYLSMLIDACYDRQDASVMKAMLLGEKGTLDKDIKSLYQQNGMIHILSLSGLHLSIMGMGLHKLLKKLKIPIAVNIILSIGIMYCYGTMTGMGMSMTRAYIMFALHLFAELVGRTYDMYTALIIAAVILLLQQPLYLRHSGFLFSFGAVCGIGLLLPAVENNLFTNSRIEKLLMSGISVTIAMLPVYLCFYYEFPPYSVLINLIVIPCMTVVLMCGLCSVGLAACILLLGMLPAYPVHFILGLYEWMCEHCMRLPGNTWIIGCPKVWQVVLFLGIIVALILWEQKIPKLMFWQGILCALCVFCVRLPSGLEITMVDVGQGDCIYLSEDDGARFLIDGGSSDQIDVADYRILPFLKYKGVDHLDAVFITHPDSDHENGIRAWLQEYEDSGISIGKLILPDIAEECRNEEYRELESLAKDNGVPLYYISSGEKLQGKEVMLTCINPEQGWQSEDTNAYSVVLHLAYRDFTALFTGDLEGEGEQKVLDQIQDSCTLLKVAHHGSRNSTSEEFLEAVQPEIALISAGKDNSYGHPHAELLERLEEAGCSILSTPEYGAITVKVGKKIQVYGYRR